jgi:hypothetical protein
MMAYGGLEVQLHQSWLRHWTEVSSELHKPAASHLGKPLSNRLCEIQSRSGRCGEERKYLVLPGIEPRP